MTSVRTKALMSNRAGRCPNGRGYRKFQGRKKIESLARLPTPCFYFAKCKAMATLAKGGRAVCRSCADKMTGVEYRLMSPATDYTVRQINRSLDTKAAFPSV